jgi:chromosomal replication initiator protein
LDEIQDLGLEKMAKENAVSAEETFELFRETLIKRYGKAIYISWFSDLLLDGAQDGVVTLSTESDLRRDRLDQQFKLGLLRAWSEDIYPIRRILFIKRDGLSASAAKVNAMAPGSKAISHGSSRTPLSTMPPRIGLGGAHATQVNGQANGPATGRTAARTDRWAPTLEEIATPLDQRMTFDNLAVDETNDVAAAAARQIFLDDSPRDIFYVFGPSGVGKSHLLQACGNEWMRRYPGGRCAYITHNNIQSGCVGALLSNSTMNLQRDFLSNDLVMIDDIHLLAGKKRTLEEVLNLINAIVSAGRQLIVAGELPPAALARAGVNDRLADRLAGGLAVRVAPGGEKLRREVLAKHRDAADVRCSINDAALDLVARIFSSSMRECIGAFKQLALVYKDHPGEIGPNEAMAALQTRLCDRRRKATLDETLAAAAVAFGITQEEIAGRAQPQRIARARHAFVYVARTALAESYPRIARVLGRDHTTAMSSLNRAEALMERDKAFKAGVAAIKVAIGAEFDAEHLVKSVA